MGRAPTSFKKTSDPAVTLDLLWRDGLFFFVLENHSVGVLRDIRVAFRRRVMGLGGRVDIAALPLWSKLSFMPAGKRIEVPIDRDMVLLAGRPGKPLNVSISYVDGQGTAWRGQITLDFEAYRDLPELHLGP